jgi:uncharacterized protein (TIGR03089 family)
METPPRLELARLLERQVRRYQDKPFLTWYDDGRGERVELSWKTFANWVAKTANLLVEELELEPGDRVALLLPAHWQTEVVGVACGLAGIAALFPPGAAGAVPAEVAAVFVREERLGELAVPPSVPVLALTADWLGRPAVDLGGARNFARAVAAMGDHFDAEEAAGQAVEGDPGIGMRLGVAARMVERLGLTQDDRLYLGVPPWDPLGAVAAGLVPLLAGAGVVLEALGPAVDAGRLWRRLADERVTVAVIAGVARRLGPLVTDLLTDGS